MTQQSIIKAMGAGLLLGGLLLGGLLLGGACSIHNKAHAKFVEAMTVKDEIHQTATLNKGARVEVSGINGVVEVKTADTDKAEINVTLSAMSRSDLEAARSNFKIEATPTSLTIKGQDKKIGGLYAIFSGAGQTRQHVTLTLPRQIELTTSGVNGRVAVGEVDGEVSVSGVNGKVSIGQATGAMRLSGVNGNIDAALANLSARGINISGINGNIALRFSGDVNAALNVSGINGRVRAEVPNVQAQNEEKNAHSYRATIGAGGAPIDVSGINGNLSLVRAGAADKEAAATPKASPKTAE